VWRELREDVEDELILLHRALDENAAEREELLVPGCGEASEPSAWQRGAAATSVSGCGM